MEWITVQESLPTNHNEEVLVVAQEPRSYQQKYLCTYHGYWWCDDTQREIKHVTHWCSIKLP